MVRTLGRFHRFGFNKKIWSKNETAS
jgi:hypothetical protein